MHWWHFGQVAFPSTTFPPYELICDYFPHLGQGTGTKNPTVFPNVTKMAWITSVKSPSKWKPLKSTLIGIYFIYFNNL